MNSSAITISSQKSFFFKLSRQRQILFMSLPIVLYIILFVYVPLWGWTMAFQNRVASNIATKNWKWVGLYWFKFMLDDKVFLKAVRNTVVMSVINTSLGFVTAIGFALLLNEVKKILFKRVIQTISYLPHFLSWVIVTGLVQSMLTTDNGAINNAFVAMGLIKEPILWYGEPNYFWGVIGITYVWKEVGWNTIIYLAAMAGIDPNLYEAAAIDGCNRYQKMWRITLPCIKPTIIILLIMSVGHILDAGFELQWLLRNSNVMDVSDTIDVYVFIYGLKNYSLGAAAGMIKNIINISLIFIANGIAKRAGEERLI